MSQTVLITGITAFLGAHVVLNFLEHGWTVHATLRSASKQPALESSPFFGKYIKSNQLKLFIAGDLASADYDAAIKGCSAVVHVASPVEFTSKDFRNDYLAPARGGAQIIIERAVKEESVKHVVMTSTYGAIGQHRQPPTAQAGLVLTEDHWNPYTLEELDAIAAAGEAPGSWCGPEALFYMGAKKYAELAAYDIINQAKGEGRDITIATMNPPMILGPPIQPQNSLSQGGMSTEILYALLGGEDAPIAPSAFPYYIDVRDLAEAHYQAVARGAEGRHIASAGPFSFQQIADWLHENMPSESHRVPVGTPGKYEYKDPGVYRYLSSKPERTLGVRYRSFDETLEDAFHRLLQQEQEGLR